MGKRVAILTGGGDCPGLNPAIRGCVMAGMDKGLEFVGLVEGWRGFVEGNTQPLGLSDVKEIVGKGGTILGTSRTNPLKKEGAVEKCLATFKKLKLDALVALGGEDTLGVASRFYKEHKLPVVGVPKTMDNDLSATDYTFGFDTATTIAVDASASLAARHQGSFIALAWIQTTAPTSHGMTPNKVRSRRRVSVRHFLRRSRTNGARHSATRRKRRGAMSSGP